MESYSMTQVPYPYKRLRSTRYLFISLGKKRIEKAVDFIPLGFGNIVNLGFGDLLPDGCIDDRANSNNGDIARVLATVVDILRHFTAHYPKAEIYFRGSTDERTRLYHRIVKAYYAHFSKEFAIGGVLYIEGENHVYPYDPSGKMEYYAFLIKRNP